MGWADVSVFVTLLPPNSLAHLRVHTVASDDEGVPREPEGRWEVWLSVSKNKYKPSRPVQGAEARGGDVRVRGQLLLSVMESVVGTVVGRGRAVGEQTGQK